MDFSLAGEVDQLPPGERAALVSTPSIYFALNPEVRRQHVVLDFDTQWREDPGFVVRLNSALGLYLTLWLVLRLQLAYRDTGATSTRV